MADDTVPRLLWERSDGPSVEFPLNLPVMVIGRDPEADIRVDEPLVSRSHARIERRGDRFVVIDLGSTNLTRVNGAVVTQCELQDGDEVRFARACCRFQTTPACGCHDPDSSAS